MVCAPFPAPRLNYASEEDRPALFFSGDAMYHRRCPVKYGHVANSNAQDGECGTGVRNLPLLGEVDGEDPAVADLARAATLDGGVDGRNALQIVSLRLYS